MKQYFLLLLVLCSGCHCEDLRAKRAIQRARFDYNCDNVVVLSRIKIEDQFAYNLDVCGTQHKYVDIGRRSVVFVEMK